jgi:hypothetical protein
MAWHRMVQQQSSVALGIVLAGLRSVCAGDPLRYMRDCAARATDVLYSSCTAYYCSCTACRYEDDRDEGEWFLYTGSGGRDLSGNKRTNKEQSFDQVRRLRRLPAPDCLIRAGLQLRLWPIATKSVLDCLIHFLYIHRLCCLCAPPAPPLPLRLQTFDSMNKALKLSCTKGLPLRVVRSFKASPAS